MNIPFVKVLLGFTLLLGLTLITGCSATNQVFLTPTASPTTAATVTVPPSPTPYLAMFTPEITRTSMVLPAQPNLTAAADQASLVNENYPDNSVLKPGDKFVKTFEIKNTGSVPWTTSYSLELDPVSQNETLGSPSQIALPGETPPGSTVSLSISLTAPETTGIYTVYWRLENGRGETVSVDGGSQVWVKIIVCDPNHPCNAPVAGGGVTASGVSVTLTDFSHDAQNATVDFCMTLPNREYSFDPAPSLLIDQKPAPFLDGGSISPVGCFEFRYQISNAEFNQAQHITLSIASVRMDIPPGDPNAACQAARINLMAIYPGLDFQCHFSGAGFYTNLQLPSGLTREQADQIIMDTIQGAIYGPWTLTIK